MSHSVLSVLARYTTRPTIYCIPTRHAALKLQLKLQLKLHSIPIKFGWN
jgi:hypothetical protein